MNVELSNFHLKANQTTMPLVKEMFIFGVASTVFKHSTLIQTRSDVIATKYRYSDKKMLQEAAIFYFVIAIRPLKDLNY